MQLQDRLYYVLAPVFLPEGLQSSFFLLCTKKSYHNHVWLNYRSNLPGFTGGLGFIHNWIRVLYFD